MGVLKNQRHELFAQGVASGLSAAKAYAKAGYEAKSADANATRFMVNDGIITRIEELKAEIAERCLDVAIADRKQRVRWLDDRAARLRMIAEERASQPELQAIPGGRSGFIVHQVKAVGKGEDFQVIDEYVVDVGFLKELRAHEQQAAQELGQWTEKQEVSGKNGGALQVIISSDLAGV